MKVSRILVTLGLVTILFLISSCAIMPKAISGLFASKTPTSTSTPTITPTPTKTNTPTVTPKPPLTIYPCVFSEQCPEAATIEDITGAPSTDFTVYDVQIPYEQPVQFITGWYAMDQSTLDEDMAHMKWIFTVDGKEYGGEDWIQTGVTSFADDPNTEYPGVWFGAVVADWKLGESHEVAIGFSIDEQIFDGWDTYEAGEYYSVYNITPARMPTATPTATATSTPKPVVKTPGALPTATKNANITYDLTLKVTNKCGEEHKVVFEGPMHLKYIVAAGSTVEYQAPQGTYTWVIDDIYDRGPQALYSSVWELTLCE